MVPASFVVGYKNAHPGATTEQIVDLYNKLLAVNPGVENMHPGQLGAAVQGAVTRHLANGGTADGTDEQANQATAPGGDVPQVIIQPPGANVSPQANVPLPDQGPIDVTPDQTPVDLSGIPGVNLPPPEEDVQQVVVTGHREPQAQQMSSTGQSFPNPQYDPYKGAGYDQSALMQQYNPAQVRSAYDTTGLKQGYDQQAEQFKQNQAARQLSGMFSGGASAGAQAAISHGFDQQDAQNLLQTIGKQSTLLGFGIKEQEALQNAATQGLAAGKSAMDIAKDQQDLFSKFGDNVIKQLGVQQQLRFNDPDSAETLSAKAALAAQMSTLPADAQAQIKSIIGQKDITAQQLMPLMSQYVPAAFKAFSDAAGIGKTVADTASQTIKNENMKQQGNSFAQQQGQAGPDYSQKPTNVAPIGGAASAPTSPTSSSTDMPVPATATPESMQIPPSVQQARDQQAVTLMQGEKATTAPQDQAALARDIAAKQTKPDFSKLKNALAQPDNMDPTYIANAKTSDLSPAQKLVRAKLESTDNGENIALDKKIAAAQGRPYIEPGNAPQMISTPSGDGSFNTSISPVSSGGMQATVQRIQNKSDGVDQFNTGGRPAAQNAYQMADSSGFNKPANWSPNTDENAAKLDLAVNRLNAESQRFGQTVNGNNGALSASAGAIGGISPLLGTAASVLGSLNSAQAITSKSPPEVIKQYAIATEVAAERQKLLISKENAFAASHNGDTAGFVNSPDYKFIMNSMPYVNQKSGDVSIPLTRTQKSKLANTGEYLPLDKMSFTTAPQPKE